MSTVNPDERARRIGLMLRPAAFTAAIAVQFLAPALALLSWLGVISPDLSWIVIYVLVWCVAGVAALLVPSARSPYLLAAFILAYVAGLFVVIWLTSPGGQFDWISLIFIPVPYLIAILLVVLHRLRGAAMAHTRAAGVDTTATVVGAAVTGMVNYVQRQRLTLKFTDNQGVERFFRIGRTGGGYSVGDRLPIRYDPAKPWSTRSILVEGSGPQLF